MPIFDQLFNDFFQIKASLRSVLTDDDEEIEIIPHVKASADFEVYESVVVKPREVVMPWDDNLKQTYDLFFSVSLLYLSWLYVHKDLVYNRSHKQLKAWTTLPWLTRDPHIKSIYDRLDPKSGYKSVD